MVQTKHRCQRAAQLLSERCDRPLALSERIGLRLHLWHCTGCLRYGRQLDLLASASEQWRREQQGDEATGGEAEGGAGPARP